MKKGIIICLVSICATLFYTEVSSRYKLSRNKKEAGLMIIKQNIINASNDDWKKMHRRIRGDLVRVQKELDRYIENYNRKINEYNIVAAGAKRGDLKLNSIPKMDTARELKRTIRETLNKI